MCYPLIQADPSVLVQRLFGGRGGAKGRVALGITPQGSHRSGRAQLRHPVRPVMGSRFRFAICERFVDPQPRFKALDGCPPHKSMTSISLPSPGSPRSRFPCFNGTMKMCESLPTFPPHFLLVRMAVPSRASVFVSPLRPDAGLGPGALWFGSPHAKT